MAASGPASPDVEAGPRRTRLSPEVRCGQILEQGRQGPDHPAHPAMAETDYLKSFILRLVRP